MYIQYVGIVGYNYFHWLHFRVIHNICAVRFAEVLTYQQKRISRRRISPTFFDRCPSLKRHAVYTTTALNV